MSMTATLLAVRGLAKHYGDAEVLAGVDFDLRPGEILGVIGPNGAGKTTLMECLAGLLSADSGRVGWRGVPLAPARRKHAMFYMPDGIAPYAEQPVYRVTGLFREVFGRPPAQERLAIERLGLAPVLGRRVEALSKGYRRRLLLALALLTPQPLLLLDEPFDGFDLRQTIAAIVLLREVSAAGRTLLLSIHQLTDAARVCDRLLLLDAGRVLGCGTLDELRAQAGLSDGSLEEVFLALT